MRSVQVFKLEHAQDPTGLLIWHKVVNGTAKFHQFGVNFEDCELGVGNFSTAIIERDDGTIENVAVEMIKFID